jgi:hypothetical protein
LLSQLVSRHGHGPFQPQNNVARQAPGNHQTKRFPGLAFYGVSKVRGARQPLWNDQPQPWRPRIFRCEHMQVEAIAAKHLAR